MRLLFVNLNRSRAFGGVERWMMDAAAGLTARGHRCTLLGRPNAPWVAAARQRGLSVREDHHGPWIARVLQMRAVMRAERPEVTIVKAKKAARMATWGRSRSRGERVAIFFGLTHELDRRRWVDRYTWRRLDAGIAVARGAADWYAAQGFGPATKVHTLWKGVDLAPFDRGITLRRVTRDELGIADGEFVVGTACRLAWQKGVDQLLEAIRLVAPRLPQARFLVVGDGRERAEIEAAAGDLGSRVRFLGHREDVPTLLAAVDLFVQPSRHEVMVQTTLEAMAAGLPVVSTRTVGADEAIVDGESGVLVPVGDASAMADAVAALGNDPGRRAMLGRAARARIEARFTLTHMLDRAERLLGRIAAGAPSEG